MSVSGAKTSADPVRPVALITGGARGLGAAMARQLGLDGFDVVIADLDRGDTVTAADELASVCGAAGARVVGLPVDVTDTIGVRTLIAAVQETFGRLDTLVNNAGIIARQSAETFDEDMWQAHFDVHLSGAIRCSQSAFGLLRDSGRGAIINVGSVGSTLGMPGRLAYTTAKTGVLGLTRVLSAEWGRHGITVNAVAPGYIDTVMMQSGLREGVLDRGVLLSRIPLERLGTPQDVAHAVSFLASDRARYITGVSLRVDGGITIDGTFDGSARVRMGDG